MLEEFYYVNTNESTAHFRHDQRANLLFVDGHAANALPVADSIDSRLPRQYVGQLPVALLRLNTP
jgi:prepilin-type processing-associated H-X9-DG protein